MHLLVVNPNSSEGVTRRIDAAARAVMRPEDRVRTVSAPFGPQLIVTPEDTQLAVKGVLAAVEAHHHGVDGSVDGIILASFGDTGIAEVRARWPQIPVIGIAGAAFAAAKALGGRFSIVSFSPDLLPSLRASVARHHMDEALSDILVVQEGSWSDPGEIQDMLAERIALLCRLASRTGEISSIVLGGGPLAGLAGRLMPAPHVPIIDGTAAAVGILRCLGTPRADPDQR